jgi:hypothetical protein
MGFVNQNGKILRTNPGLGVFEFNFHQRDFFTGSFAMDTFWDIFKHRVLSFSTYLEVLLREALDDLLLKYEKNDFEP